MEKRVSIVLCTYNGERYLDEQLTSIIEQTYSNFHLIIVDDCSGHNTFEILKEWQSIYPDKITLHRHDKNVGYNENFAFALGLAKGDYIAISDQDDIWLPNKIREQVSYMETNPHVILTHHMELKIIDGEVQKEEIPLIRWAIDYEGMDFRRFVLINVVSGHQIVFKKELLSKVIPFPPGSDYVYDWWISTVALLYGHIGYVREVLAYHRLHETNAWFTKDRAVNKVTQNVSFYEPFLNKRYLHLKKLPLSGKHLKFVEQIRSLLLERERSQNNKKLFWFLLRHRKHIFPVTAKYAILAEYAYLKRCFTYYKKY